MCVNVHRLNPCTCARKHSSLALCICLTVSSVILILAIVQNIIWACPHAPPMLFAFEKFALILALAVQYQLTLAVG